MVVKGQDKGKEKEKTRWKEGEQRMRRRMAGQRKEGAAPATTLLVELILHFP